MTRPTGEDAMSSEHVEVLRHMKETIKAIMPSEVAALDAAIASLSAQQPPAVAQPVGGGEALEAELIALVAGPYHYHHKMDEHAEREGKAFDRCRELTIQNIRTWCATRRAMLEAASPSAPVGVEAVEAALQKWLDWCNEHNEEPEARSGARIAIEALVQQPAAVDGVWIRLCGSQGEPAGTMTVTAGLRDGSEVVLIRDTGNEIDHSVNLAAALAGQQPAAVGGDNPYPAPRNRQEAAALAKLALAYLGVTSAHIDAAVARCETDLAAQQGGSDND